MSQNNDLEHMNPDGSDNLQKSERPAKDYIEDRGLCKSCHAIINDHGKCAKGCK